MKGPSSPPPRQRPAFELRPAEEARTFAAESGVSSPWYLSAALVCLACLTLAWVSC